MRIISIHMPKAGGLTFRNHLEYIYGKKNVFHDYTHCGRPDYKNAPPPPYILDKLRRTNKTTVVHGHFLMKRYANIPAAHFVCWMRDPIERLLSHYYYWLRAPDPDHPSCQKLVKEGLSVTELAELMPNMFTRRFSPLDIDDFAFVGLADADKYTESLNLFYAMFCPNKRVRTDIHENHNAIRGNGEYKFEQRRKLEKINRDDVDLYKRAIDRFNRLQNKYGNGF